MVAIAEWKYLYPSRTQKSSTQTSKIVEAKIESCHFFCVKISKFVEKKRI